MIFYLVFESKTKHSPLAPRFFGDLNSQILMIRIAHIVTAYESVITILDSKLRGLAAFDGFDVTTDAGGIPEVVENNISGLIVPKQNSDALGEALLKIIKNVELRKRLGRAARKRILEHFSLDVMVDRYVEFYSLLIEQ